MATHQNIHTLMYITFIKADTAEQIYFLVDY